jgi:hypothetical protein
MKMKKMRERMKKRMKMMKTKKKMLKGNKEKQYDYEKLITTIFQKKQNYYYLLKMIEIY